MRFLPIVDRELREGSRRRGTYWLRVRVAFMAVLIGVVVYFITRIQSPFRLGTMLFWGLAGLSMMFCLLAGRRSTVDCISQEKREGTLGLLFLTDLKGYDVVLGKLAATSISSFYALVAIFPVMAIPLLAGGVTNGEFWRMVLVLINTFFLSLAIGIFASAVNQTYRGAMATNFAMMMLIMALPPMIAFWLEGIRKWHLPWLFYSCPIFSFWHCGDTRNPFQTRDFWLSLAASHGLAWLLTLFACWIVPRNWQDKPASSGKRWRWRNLGRIISYGSVAKCAAFRKVALDSNAYYWMSSRARLKPTHIWIFLDLVAAGWVFLSLGEVWWGQGLRSFAGWPQPEAFFGCAAIVNTTLKLWMVVEAGQRLGEDRRAGAFELLLATPMTVDDFLRGQLQALRRQFLKPVFVVLTLEVVFLWSFKNQWSLEKGDVVLAVACIFTFCADMLALGWVSMWAALTCKTATQSSSYVVVRIMILPWILFFLSMVGIELLRYLEVVRDDPGEYFRMGLWFFPGLAADLFFGLMARRMLKKNFRQLAVQSFLAEAVKSPWWSIFVKSTKWAMGFARRCFPPKVQKPLLAALIITAVLVTSFKHRHSNPSFPPPVMVSITQSNAPFKIFPGGPNGVLFVMPDGTLWQWGKPSGPQLSRSVVPEQIGTDHDWVKAVGTGTHCLGLKSDGTIFGWGFSNGRLCPEPKPAVPGNDWIDLGTGQHHAAAVNKKGELWTWDEPLVGNNGQPSKKTLEPGGHWLAVYCGNDSTFALNADGTLCAGGTMTCFVGISPVKEVFKFPTLFCQDSNWISLDASGVARNRHGELWDVRSSSPNWGVLGTPPNPTQLTASQISTMVSSGGDLDRIHSVSPWTKTEIHSDGTLWMTRMRPSFPASDIVEAWHQVSTQSDWVGIWGEEGAEFGLTSHGMLWTWGKELGIAPVKNYESRLQLLRDHLTGRRLNASGAGIHDTAEPRPLLRLMEVKKNSK